MLDIRGDPEAKDQHQECGTQQREGEPHGIAPELQRFASRIGQQTPQADDLATSVGRMSRDHFGLRHDVRA
jgi:hypothetical protein